MSGDGSLFVNAHAGRGQVVRWWDATLNTRLYSTEPIVMLCEALGQFAAKQ